MHGLDRMDINAGALYRDSNGFDMAAEYILKYEGRDTRLIYYGDTISWYGYFYLAERNFFSAEPVYDIEAVRKIKKDKMNILLVNTTKTGKGTVGLFRKNYEVLNTVSVPGIEDKYIIFNLKPISDNN